jgi:uncharacterized protein (TIGR02246 family)
MMRHALRGWLVVFGVVVVGATSRADEVESNLLQATVDKYAAAYNAGDVAKVMDFWTEDADFVDIRGNFYEGRDLIAALFRRGFASSPGRTIKVTSEARKFLAPTVAMDDGILELTSAEGDVSRGRYAVVWTKVGDDWRIRSARDIPLEVDEADEPESPPPLEDLAWLVGKWAAKSEKYEITLDCDWLMERSFLAQRFHIKSADEDFRVLTLIAYDPAEGRFRSWYFDSRGGFGGGPWSKRGDVWRTAVVAVLPDGQIGSSFMTWQQIDENTAKWQAVEREVNGEPLSDAEQTYVRVKTAAVTPAN